MSDDLAPASGLGEAKPAFVHNERTGVTATPPLPTLQPKQFGSAPNWSQAEGPQVSSALLK